jgi:menaquinone-dependent protoporphyrinogen IX oxidase
LHIPIAWFHALCAVFEPAATDKDAFIVAHPGAAEYFNDEIKPFVERYADLMYFAPAALSIIGTIFAVSRSRPSVPRDMTTMSPRFLKRFVMGPSVLLISEKKPTPGLYPIRHPDIRA